MAVHGETAVVSMAGAEVPLIIAAPDVTLHSALVEMFKGLS